MKSLTQGHDKLLYALLQIYGPAPLIARMATLLRRRATELWRQEDRPAINKRDSGIATMELNRAAMALDEVAKKRVLSPSRQWFTITEKSSKKPIASIAKK